jgi:two-component system response regulator PilR (NtrC family)/two-component system response regulator HydG
MEKQKHILLVEDDKPLREALVKFLGQHDLKVTQSACLADAMGQLQENVFDLVLLDLTLPDGNGLDILERFSPQYSGRMVVLTGTGSIETAVLAMKKGAHDFLQKPVNPELLLITLQRVFDFIQARSDCQDLKKEIGAMVGFDKFIFASKIMGDVIQSARRYAATPHTILISGETGTGKELMAQAIHACSPRKKQPLLSVNCASIPENLAESELFGYKKGAFTGAYADSPGKFVLADQGTIFLDEIGELPANIQAKLLRVLENGEVTPLKSKDPVRVDIRVLAATNKDLEDEVRQKRFRADLFYRIDELKIQIPPLCERKSDILPLADHFLRIANLANSTPPSAISGEAQRLLTDYSWPGNVRELKNTIFKISASGHHALIRPEHLPVKIRHPEKNAGGEERELSLAEIEIGHIRKILGRTGQNHTLAAEILGISRSSLYRKVQEWQKKIKTGRKRQYKNLE